MSVKKDGEYGLSNPFLGIKFSRLSTYQVLIDEHQHVHGYSLLAKACIQATADFT